ncbi:MAG: phosphoribosylanthranilate isomerase [Wenzhouxiangella sp.]|nr:MAG: phosphoribosylanthranilate isomerase [Wenzhouxiangella sp.]
MIRVKICGITRIEDALAAAEAGVDAIGLVFVKRSSRCVSLDDAAEICAALPPFVNRVGLFMDQPEAEVWAGLDRVRLDWLQFHGAESEDYCARFGRPWIKAIAMADSDAAWEQHRHADALLLDSHASGELGGSGKRFDWERVPRLGRPWILAGGLDPGNVAQACRQLKPAGVDVSSGVEIRPGIKDGKLMKRFIEAVKNG